MDADSALTAIATKHGFDLDALFWRRTKRGVRRLKSLIASRSIIYQEMTEMGFTPYQISEVTHVDPVTVRRMLKSTTPKMIPTRSLESIADEVCQRRGVTARDLFMHTARGMIRGANDEYPTIRHEVYVLARKAGWSAYEIMLGYGLRSHGPIIAAWRSARPD